MFDLVATEVLIRVRPATLDSHGAPTGDPDRADVEGCVVWPSDGNATAGNEQTFAQTTVISGLTALLPPGTDALATDQWERDDDLYEQVGEPAVYVSPFTGDTPGVLIVLKRVTG
ncbi:MAG: hypothetical protein JWP14_3378 [Frankiales bacterium]|nr:hypothetical protein [Frankiales bacterium]